jgi:hypothetical protein
MLCGDNLLDQDPLDDEFSRLDNIKSKSKIPGGRVLSS